MKLSEFGTTKDLAFGSSRFYQTPEECSNEVWKFGAPDYKAEIDVFTLGTILCEMLTGEKVWMHGNMPDEVENRLDPIINRILTQAPARLPDHVSRKLKYNIYLML